MTDFRNAFRQLSDGRPPRGADQVFAGAQRLARQNRLRRRTVFGAGAVALVVLAAIGLGALGDDGSSVETHPGPVATGPAPTDQAPPDPPPGQPGNVTVEVHFSPDAGGSLCDDTTAVERTVEGPAVLGGAFQELLEGPTAEERAAGLTSWFSEATASALRSAEIVDGTAQIDFRDFSGEIANASTSCGSTNLLSQLERTALQFPAVQRTLYSFNGNVEAFYGWLQRSPPDHYTPPASVAVDDVDRDLLLFGRDGIARVVDASVQQIWAEPVARAFDDGSGWVVFQDGGTNGAIRWLGDGAPAELVGPGERSVLHGVVELDGAPTVLFTRATGGQEPEKEEREERLFGLSLAAGIERDLGVTGGIESGLDAVALSAQGLLVSRCHLQCGVHVLGGAEGEEEVILPADWISGLDARGDVVAFVRSTFDPERGDTTGPVLVLAGLDGQVRADVPLPERIQGQIHVDLSEDGTAAVIWAVPYDTGEVAGSVLVDGLNTPDPDVRLLETTQAARFA